MTTDLSRRSLLKSVGKVSVGASALTMLGCGGLLFGGGGPGGGLLNQKTYTGTVSLPGGIDLTDLKISGAGTAKNLNAGNFSVNGFEQFPTLVSIIEPSSGKALLLGMLDPNSTTHTINATNCAATLLFLALGGSQLFGDERQSFWTAVMADSGVAALAGVIEARLTVDKYALENQDSQIIAALNAAATGSSTAPLKAKSSKSNSLVGRGRVEDAVEIVFVHPQTAAHANGLFGATFNNQGFGLGSSVRRETFVHLYINERRFSDGTVGGPVEVDQITPFRIGPNADAEKRPIGLYEDDSLDYYDLVCLTPVFDCPESSVFTTPRYEGQKATWRAELKDMYQLAMIGLVCKALLEAVGMSGVTLDREVLKQVVTNLQGLGGDTAGLVLQARDGTGLSAGVSAFASLARTGDQMALDYLAAIAPLVQTSNPVLYYDLSHRTYKTEELSAFRAKLRLIAYTGAMALSLQLGVEYRDLTTGTNGELCRLVVSRDDIMLSPSGGTYTPGQNIPFHVAVAFTGTFTYKWELHGIANASLDDGHGNVGASFESDRADVTFKPQSNAVGTANVSVEVIRHIDGGTESAGTKSTILPKVGTMALGVNSWKIDVTTYLLAMAIFEKPKTVEGGNHYKGGRLRIDVLYDRPDSPGTAGTARMYYDVPAFTGLPSSEEDYPVSKGAKLQKLSQSSFTGQAGVDVYDMGDKVVIVKSKGQYFDSSSQQDIDFVKNHLQMDCTWTTMSNTFTPT